jgi:hypothetical protein
MTAGIAQGYRDAAGELTGEFGPHQNVTYAEALKMIFTVTHPDDSFDASGTEWFMPYVSYARELGISITKSDALIHQPLTKAEVVQIIIEALGVSTSEKTTVYDDVAADHPAVAAIALATEYGLINGEMIAGQRLFRPENFMTRAEIAKILGVLLQQQ